MIALRITNDQEECRCDVGQHDADHLQDQPWDEEPALPFDGADQEEDVAEGQDEPHDQGPDTKSLILSLSPLGPV